MTQMFGWMTPGDVKVFKLGEQTPEAIRWAAGD